MLGGNAVAALLPSLGVGALGNSLAGLVGGGLGAQLLVALGGAGGTGHWALLALSAAALAGGAAVLALIGLARNLMTR